MQRRATVLIALTMLTGACSSSAAHRVSSASVSPSTTAPSSTTTATTATPELVRNGLQCTRQHAQPKDKPQALIGVPPDYYPVPAGARLVRPTALPAPPPPFRRAVGIAGMANVAMDWMRPVPNGDGLEILTLDLGTGRFTVRPGPASVVSTGTTPTTLNTKVFVLSATARVRGGLVAASTHETRWYPNGSGSSRVLDTVPGVSAAAVYYDAATDRAVVLRGTGPYAVMVVDGNGNVVMRRVVGYSIPTATPGHSGYEPLAVDSGEIYFATTYGGENRLVRYDIATLDSVFVADVDPFSLWGASRGWLVSPLYKNNTGPRPAATALGRAGGTQCRGAYPAIPGCCTLLGLDRSGAHGLVKTSDRGGGGIYTIDIVTGATTSLVGAYAGMNGSMFDSGWVLACGTVNTPGHLVVVQPPGADGRANVQQLGRVPGMGYDTCTGTAGEVAPGQPAA